MLGVGGESLLCDCYGTVDLPQCEQCCHWNMLSSSPANEKVKASEIKTTEKYPTVVDPNSLSKPRLRGVPSNCLKPVGIDLEWLLCALRYAAHDVLHSRWNKGVARAYCKSAAIPEYVTKKMIDRFLLDIGFCRTRIWVTA